MFHLFWDFFVCVSGVPNLTYRWQQSNIPNTDLSEAELISPFDFTSFFFALLTVISPVSLQVNKWLILSIPLKKFFFKASHMSFFCWCGTNAIPVSLSAPTFQLQEWTMCKGRIWFSSLKKKPYNPLFLFMHLLLAWLCASFFMRTEDTLHRVIGNLMVMTHSAAHWLCFEEILRRRRNVPRVPSSQGGCTLCHFALKLHDQWDCWANWSEHWRNCCLWEQWL